jgi:RNA polymerase sigma-70 factor (ECF subfamily)
MNERELIAGFLEGEEGAFNALYAAHAPALYAFLRRMVRDDADDALQDVWLRAARDLGRFRHQSSFRTWLFGIAMNRAREIFRLTAVIEEELPEIAGEAPPLADHIDLDRAIARLPMRYREVFTLHDIHEYTHAEIAGMLGIDEGTSKSNLSRARASLRKWIGEP